MDIWDMIFSMFFILLGSGLTISGIFNLVKSNRLATNGISVDATVVDYELVERSIWSEHSAYDRHFVTFSYVVGGAEYQTRYELVATLNEPRYFIDETVQIYCDKNNPEKLVISDDKNITRSNIACVVLGIALIILGIGYIIFK